MNVSIVIPCYNGEKFLGEAIESVLAQTYPNWELIIVDDGSTDGSLNVARQYAENDQRIQIARHPDGRKLGVSLTRKRGFDLARGDWVALLDADDIFLPSKLEKQVGVAIANPECVMIHSAGKCINARSRVIEGPSLIDSFNAFSKNPGAYQLREREDLLCQNFVLNSSAMIRRDALHSIPYGFNQLFQYEDWTLWIRLSAKGPFYVMSDDLVRYRQHGSSATEKVVNNTLVEAFSHIEFVLSVLATESDSQIRQSAANVLQIKLQQATHAYQQSVETVGDGQKAEYAVANTLNSGILPSAARNGLLEVRISEPSIPATKRTKRKSLLGKWFRRAA